MLANDLYDGQTIDARLALRRLAAARIRRRGLGRGARRWTSTPATLEPLRRAAGRPARGACARSRSGPRRRARRWSTSARTSSAGCGSPCGDRRAGDHLRHAEVLEHGELGVRPLRTREGHGPVRPERRRGRLRADLHLPRLPLRRGHRLARRADRRRPRRRSSSHSELRAHRHLRVLRRAAQPAAPQRRLGAARATSSTCRPTARSATSGWAGPATSRSFAPTAAFLYDVERLPAGLAARPRRRAAGTPTAWCRFVVPDVLKYVDAPPEFPAPGHHRDLERRRGLGAVGAAGRRTATARCLPRQYRLDGRARPPGRGAALADRACGTAASSSATGSTRRRRRTTRPRPRPTTASWRPPALLPQPRDRGGGGRAARATTTTPASSRHSRPGSGRPSTSTTCTTTARVRSDCPTVYALAIAFGLLDGADGDSSPGTGWPSWSAENGYRIVHRVRRDAVHHRRADRHRAPRRRLPAAARAGVPVVALPGDHGRHHDLGALGLDAARRHDQPGRDDQLQPLRPRRGGRLDAPGRSAASRPPRRATSGCASLRTRRRPHLGEDLAADAAREIRVAWEIVDGELGVESSSRKASRPRSSFRARAPRSSPAPSR